MTQTVVAPVLVLGWGNLSRGDDALGPLFAGHLREHYADAPDVECLDDYQLQVEHALDLAVRQRVLFVDASLTCMAPFEVTQPCAAKDASFTTHSLSPQALLQVYWDLHGVAPPPCTLLAIRAEHFELGAPPGPEALKHLKLALQWAHSWVADACAACENQRR